MPLGPTMHMLAAAESGALTLLLTNPIWVVKTRLCLQCDSGSSAEYRGMVHALAEIYKTEGIRGLYRGFVPGMLGVSHGAIQFMTYEEMKNAYNEYRKLPIDTKLVCISLTSYNHMTKKRVAYASLYNLCIYRYRRSIYPVYIRCPCYLAAVQRSSSLAYSHPTHLEVDWEYARLIRVSSFSFSLSSHAGHKRISGIRSDVEANCRRGNISISGGAGTPAGSSSSIQRHLGLH